MITLLTYISLIAGGLLVLLLLLGIVGGIDLDTDLDASDSPGMGDVGIVKGGLTFLSIGSLGTRLALVASSNPLLSIISGLAAGAIAVYLLHLTLRLLLSQEANVNWAAEDAVSRSGDVYLRIPVGGRGIVRVEINGGVREFQASSDSVHDIPTGSEVTVEGCSPDGVLLVRSVAAQVPHGA